jgi:hypothetical protein
LAAFFFSITSAGLLRDPCPTTLQKMHIANSDKPVEFYNLDVIISVGYRVKSHQGTRFRQCATGTLREHLTRGLNLNRQALVCITRITDGLHSSVVEKPVYGDVTAGYLMPPASSERTPGSL